MPHGTGRRGSADRMQGPQLPARGKPGCWGGGGKQGLNRNFRPQGCKRAFLPKWERSPTRVPEWLSSHYTGPSGRQLRVPLHHSAVAAGGAACGAGKGEPNGSTRASAGVGRSRPASWQSTFSLQHNFRGPGLLGRCFSLITSLASWPSDLARPGLAVQALAWLLRKESSSESPHLALPAQPQIASSSPQTSQGARRAVAYPSWAQK